MLARYRVSALSPNLADAASAEALLTQPQPYANHNGGMIALGPDSHLHIALGDGGSGGDPHGNSHSLATLLGKLLRLDASRPGGCSIPASNPFPRGGGRPEVWALGPRNPWRFSFDRATGSLIIADVGRNALEEVDLEPAGARAARTTAGTSGRARAGSAPGPRRRSPCSHRGVRPRGGALQLHGRLRVPRRGRSAAAGWCLDADSCAGTLWVLANEGARWVTRVLLETGLGGSSLGEDEADEVDVVDHDGAVLRVAPSP